MCRVIPHADFNAPQFSGPNDPLQTIAMAAGGNSADPGLADMAAATTCCAACRDYNGTKPCRGWTIRTNSDATRSCLLVSQTSTTSASLSAFSGYPVGDDAASFCAHADDNGANIVMMDRHVPPSIGCGSMNTGPGGPPRGTAWMFFPCGGDSSTAGAGGRTVCQAAEHCDCSRTDNEPGSMTCKGADFDQGMIAKHVKGKAWSVFVHGGEFAWNNNIGAHTAPTPPRA
jgi:hypothetical protein